MQHRCQPSPCMRLMNGGPILSLMVLCFVTSFVTLSYMSDWDTEKAEVDAKFDADCRSANAKSDERRSRKAARKAAQAGK